jgi:hypothetical protein
MKYLSKMLSILFFTVLAMKASSQNSDAYQQQHANQIESSLRSKGIFVKQGSIASMSPKDLTILDSYDFNSMRNEKTRRLVSLVNGPVLELESLNELKLRHQVVNDDLYSFKSDEQISNDLKPIITKLDLGLGKLDVGNSEKWQTKD